MITKNQLKRVRTIKHVFATTMLVLGITITASLPITAQPKIFVDKKEINLGIIYNGENKASKIIVKNTGNDSLRIMAMQTSCGCTTVKEPKKALGPGQSDEVEVAFNSTGFRGQATKYVTFVSNDPKTPNLTVNLNAEVKEELEPVTHSSVLWLGTLPIGQEIQQSFTFKNVSGHPISIKRMTYSSPILLAKPEKHIVPPSDTVRIFITVTPDKDGYFNGELFLETDSNKQSRVPLRITFIGTKPS